MQYLGVAAAKSSWDGIASQVAYCHGRIAQ